MTRKCQGGITRASESKTKDKIQTSRQGKARQGKAKWKVKGKEGVYLSLYSKTRIEQCNNNNSIIIIIIRLDKSRRTDGDLCLTPNQRSLSTFLFYFLPNQWPKPDGPVTSHQVDSKLLFFFQIYLPPFFPCCLFSFGHNPTSNK